VPVVAGVIGEVPLAALGTMIERAPEGRRPALQELAQHLPLPGRQRGAKAFEIGRSVPDQHLVQAQRAGGRADDRGHGPTSEIGHAGVQPPLMLGLTETGQVRVDDRRRRAVMAEVDLELPQVLALFEQMRGVTVPQRMDMGGLGDATGTERQAEGPLQGRAAHRRGGRGRALAGVALGGEEQAGMPMGLPLLAQQFERALRQGHVAIPVALAAPDVQEHAFAIDVAHFQAQPLAQPQAARVDGGQRHALIEGADLGQDAADLGGREDDRQFDLRGGAGELQLRGPGPLEGFLPEELDGAEGLGGGLAGELPNRLEVQEVVAEIFRRELVGGAVEMLAQLADAGPVGLLRAGLEGQQAEVVGEAVQDCVRRGLFLSMAMFHQG